MDKNTDADAINQRILLLEEAIQAATEVKKLIDEICAQRSAVDSPACRA